MAFSSRLLSGKVIYFTEYLGDCGLWEPSRDDAFNLKNRPMLVPGHSSVSQPLPPAPTHTYPLPTLVPTVSLHMSVHKDPILAGFGEDEGEAHRNRNKSIALTHR
jgi:hypothetical protein